MIDRVIGEGLTFDDVLLIPRRSEVLPRDAKTETRIAPGIELPLPILSSAMDTVTGAELATTLARLGGLGVLHKNSSPQEQAAQVRQVKEAEVNGADRPALDGEGRLLAAAAVSVAEYERAACLVEAGVDLLVVDSAHGHAEGILETVRTLKKSFQLPVMGGNVATAAGTLDLIEAGADAVKIGVGPGSICTTRVVAGVGVPQLTALFECCAAAAEHGIPIISDGGIRHSGDAVKALAAGARAVMLGRLLSGTDEAPGTRVTVDGRIYKSYRGMGSVSAMAAGSANRYGQSTKRAPAKFVPEGVEGLVPSAGPLAAVVHQLAGGLQSGMGYLGASALEDLREVARFIRQTSAGYRESHPHGLASISSAPNYAGRDV